MLKPTYSVTIGAGSINSSSPGPLEVLEIRRVTSGGADEAIISLGRVPAISAAEGDAVSIELGWDGSNEMVFTGVVDRVESGIGRVEVVCLGSQRELLRQRDNKTFKNQSAGDVVQALASQAGVTVENAEAGIDLPVYLVDSGRSFYEHCLGLALRCGFDLYATAEGRLVFAKFSVASANHTFRYGEHIITAAIEKGKPLDGVSIVPESPASSSGDDTVSWLVKDPSGHRFDAGGGAANLLFRDSILRTKDGAKMAAEGRLAVSKRGSVKGEVSLLGSSQVHPGGALALEKVPDPGIDGTYQIMGVRHRLDKKWGFRTFISLGGMP